MRFVFHPLFLLLPIWLLSAKLPAQSATSSSPLATAKLHWDLASDDATQFTVRGAVMVGVAWEGSESSVSRTRGGSGRAAHFEGGSLLGRSAAPLLQGADSFTLYVRFKPENAAVRGTIVVQRGPGQQGSGAFDLMAWSMPFLERQHLGFHSMPTNGLAPRAGKYVSAINTDLGDLPTSPSGWRDVIVTRRRGGPLELLVDGRRVARREKGSINPGPIGWSFDGPRSPLVVGANAEGADPFYGWIERVALWDRALADAEMGALVRGRPIVDAVVPQRSVRNDIRGIERVFAPGVLTPGAAPSDRYDWIDAKLPAFRERLATTDPHYPRFHLTLPGEQWNPIALYHRGKYHVFFGWTTGGCFRYFDDANENIVWQHIVSEDLVHWRILPMPIRHPHHPNENGVFFVNDQGEVVVFYFGDRGMEPRMAVSRDPDLSHWEAFPERVKFRHVPPEYAGVRHDPSAVFKRGEDWYLVGITVRPQAKSLGLPLYKSRDLITWDYAGVFYEDATGRPINECGQLWRIDGRDVFTAIHDLSKGAQYLTGIVRDDGTFARHYAGVPDYASASYNCVSTAVDDAGRATMWRFMNIVRSLRESSAAGWWNTYTLPRAVRLDGAGRMLLRPSPAMDQLRSKHFSRTLAPGAAMRTLFLEELRAASAEVRWQFAPAASGATGIRLSDGVGHLEAYYDHVTREVVLDPSGMAATARGGGEAAGDNGDGSRLSARAGRVLRAPVSVPPGQPVTLRFFSDRSIFEIYAQDEVVISHVGFFAHPEALRAAVFDRSGSPLTVSVDAWEMKSLEWSNQVPSESGKN